MAKEEKEEVQEPTIEEEFDLDIERDARINKLRLDEENETQSVTFNKYARALAEAKDARDRAKEYMDHIRKARSLHHRESPPDGIKITESVIAELTEKDRVVNEAVMNYLDAQYVVNRIEADVDAMQHRRSSLKNLTMLWVGGYYSGPESTKEDERSGVSEGLRNKLSKRSREQVSEDIEESEEGE